MEIKEMRMKLGMTQEEFGRMLGIPRRTIQNWEIGQRKCPEYVISLIYWKLKDLLEE